MLCASCSSSKLEAVLQEVPQLRRVLAAMQHVEEQLYSCILKKTFVGTKLMRLVSKHCKDLMTPQRFQLKLFSQLDQSLMKQTPVLQPHESWSVLRKANLTHLTVEVEEKHPPAPGRDKRTRA